MKSHSRMFAAAALLLTLALFAGCSDDTSPTNPPAGSTLTFNSGAMPNGRSFQMTFPTAGTAPYVCGIHPGTMFGNSVTVAATATLDSVVVTIVSLSTPGFSPSAVTIKPNGYVRWVNADAMTHSVESR
ncbi:MAG TPA: hypothetical protein VEY91_02740 [Candidatus Limnocylindria bacterium]|nr:hypothetical protein [Candidatus Limnocylindria bacterium]